MKPFSVRYRRQEEVAAEREEIDRQKKLLVKKRPSNETSRKRFSNNQTSSTVPNSSTTQSASNNVSVVTNNNTVMHNGIDHSIFLKPDAVLSNTLTWQEYYEADEILKVTLRLPFFFCPNPPKWCVGRDWRVICLIRVCFRFSS